MLCHLTIGCTWRRGGSRPHPIARTRNILSPGCTVRQRPRLYRWEKGYEGASMDDLTTATGIPPEIHVAFRNKYAVFERAHQRYLC
jgi:hypothetical protein